MELGWHDLIEIEPRLVEILEEAKQVEDDRTKRYFCAYETWVQIFRPRVIDLVGLRATDIVTCNSAAFQVVLNEIRKALPECRICNCNVLHSIHNWWHVNGNFREARTAAIKAGKT